MRTSDGRLPWIDAWRVIAIVAVVAIHTVPTRVTDPSIAANWREPSFLIVQMARFAVPYFFVISGYLWAFRAGNSTRVLRDSMPGLRRIGTIFALWSLVYALPYDVAAMQDGGFRQAVRVAAWRLVHQAEHPLTLVTQGTKSPLWFLVALACAMTISALFVQRRAYGALTVTAVALYAVQLLAKPYEHTPFGLQIDFNTRNGPFVGTLFFVAGIWLSRMAPRASWAVGGLSLFIVGAALHLAENWWVARHFGITTSQDFVVGTIPMGVGIALLALSGRGIPGMSRLARWGGYTLGVYVVHPLYVDWFQPLTTITPSIAAHVLTIALVTLFSLVTVELLRQSRLTSTLVR